uniref:Uncharacterized protein LOC105057888 n=1 Tax=Elaeis guineensis var. tenera TaxID=51953 RepID=A0A6I9SG09_ELAGV|nr:uncharacterized protein LOC105057888 [Elaeis guineensis]
MDETVDEDEVPLDMAEEEETQESYLMKKAHKVPLAEEGNEVSQEEDKECYHNKNNQVHEKVNYAKKEEGEDGILLLAEKGEEASNENIWYLDTGASNHMCGYKHMFKELDETVEGNVSFGDTSKVQVKGIGKILIQLKNGS